MPIHQRPFLSAMKMKHGGWVCLAFSFNISFYNIVQMGCFGCCKQRLGCVSPQHIHCNYTIRSSYNEFMNLKAALKHVSRLH